jgi:hypothetical protein
MSWDKYIKRYVWDDNKTPYFVAVRRLNKSQAEHELFAYTLFIGVLFAVLSIISLTDNAPHGKSYTLALYTFSVSGSAVLFAVIRHVYAAYYLALAPLASLAYFSLGGLPPNLATIDKLALVIITLALLRYSMRVVAIAKAYPQLPDASEGGSAAP